MTSVRSSFVNDLSQDMVTYPRAANRVVGINRHKYASICHVKLSKGSKES